MAAICPIACKAVILYTKKHKIGECMQKIVSHLWFDTQAKQAAEFYCSVFPNSAITSSRVLHNTPSGDCDVMGFTLDGHDFMAISAGPYFTINQSISFMVNFDPSRDNQTEEHLRELWGKLADGGTVLMALQQYPFSKLYGWVQDKFGVGWQLILTDPNGEPRPSIIPSLLFAGQAQNKAQEAMKFYVSVFKNSKEGMVAHYPEGSGGPVTSESVMFADVQLENQWFALMDSGEEQTFSFNEAVSLLVHCDSQEEIDYYWEKLSAVPEAEQCGWLKDKFGVSWQIAPTAMDAMMAEGSPEQIERVTKAFLQMKKFDIAALQAAYDGS